MTVNIVMRLDKMAKLSGVTADNISIPTSHYIINVEIFRRKISTKTPHSSFLTPN